MALPGARAWFLRTAKIVIGTCEPCPSDGHPVATRDARDTSVDPLDEAASRLPTTSRPTYGAFAHSRANDVMSDRCWTPSRYARRCGNRARRLSTFAVASLNLPPRTAQLAPRSAGTLDDALTLGTSRRAYRTSALRTGVTLYPQRNWSPITEARALQGLPVVVHCPDSKSLATHSQPLRHRSRRPREFYEVKPSSRSCLVPTRWFRGLRFRLGTLSCPSPLKRADWNEASALAIYIPTDERVTVDTLKSAVSTLHGRSPTRRLGFV